MADYIWADGIVWASGARITLRQDGNRLYWTLYGSAAYTPSGAIGGDIYYRLYFNNEYQYLIHADQIGIEHFDTIKTSQYGTTITVKFAAEGISGGTTFTTFGPSNSIAIKRLIAWDSGAYITAEMQANGDIFTTRHGNAHLENGATGTISYVTNVIIDGQQYDLGNPFTPPVYDKEMTIAMWGRVVINGAYVYTPSITTTITAYSGNIIKIYSGSQWRFAEIYRYVGDGSGDYGTNNNWKQCTAKVYNGSQFVTPDYN